MKKLFLLFFALYIVNLGYGQDYYKDFLNFQKSKDTLNQLKTLRIWEKAYPNDAELYTSYFNYFFAKARSEVITLTKEQPNGKMLVLMDSTNKIEGYLGDQIEFARRELNKGFDWINKGIRLYPSRLDMRFGKIYALGQIKDWANFAKEIITTIHFSQSINNNWTWTKNEKKNGGKDFFLSCLQDYQLQLYNTGDDKLLPYMREIAKEVLKIYPDHVESLSNLSVVYMISKDYAKALEFLLKAEKISPHDYIVLSNIAHCYKEKGEKTKSIVYYEKTIKYGDEQSKEFAQKQIEELKK